jgi:hypothetical protein
MMNRCTASVRWLELDIDRRCIRPDDHEGFHRDGVWFFTSEGLRVPRDTDRRDRAEVTADTAIREASR